MEESFLSELVQNAANSSSGSDGAGVVTSEDSFNMKLHILLIISENMWTLLKFKHIASCR